jgi:hypothetical protein
MTFSPHAASHARNDAVKSQVDLMLRILSHMLVVQLLPVIERKWVELMTRESAVTTCGLAVKKVKLVILLRAGFLQRYCG